MGDYGPDARVRVLEFGALRVLDRSDHAAGHDQCTARGLGPARARAEQVSMTAPISVPPAVIRRPARNCAWVI